MVLSHKRNKYGNTKVEYDGHSFDSKKEMKRYIALRQAQDNGVIFGLELQPRFELIPKITETYTKQLKTKTKQCERVVQLAITYNGDFAYVKDGQKVVEDVKASPKTAALDKAFLIKEKLFRYRMGFSIKRVYNPNDLI